jgi:prevent-host-death family protein
VGKSGDAAIDHWVGPCCGVADLGGRAHPAQGRRDSIRYQGVYFAPSKTGKPKPVQSVRFFDWVLSMRTSNHVGLEQARSELPRLVTEAQAGSSAVITRHGKPCAALVPLERLQNHTRRGGLLSLRGTGAGLWGPNVAATVSKLRNEWD